MQVVQSSNAENHWNQVLWAVLVIRRLYFHKPLESRQERKSFLTPELPGKMAFDVDIRRSSAH